MNEFDDKAASWDDDPARGERARKVADVIREQIALNPDMIALEYGCGTGLLSFNLYPYLKHVTMADNSDGMLAILADKIVRFAVPNMAVVKTDLTTGVASTESYDLIYTLMTLHHVEDIDSLLGTLNAMLNPAGHLCIADLDREDGTFHGEGFSGHNGFDRMELARVLAKNGFVVSYNELCFDVKKRGADGTIGTYPAFVMIAQKVSRG